MLYVKDGKLAICSTCGKLRQSTCIHANCVGWWKLDDNKPDSIILDSSGNGYDGTLYNGGSPADTADHHITGKLNGALDFDGINDYVDIGDLSAFQFERTDAFSIAVLVKVALGSSEGTVVAKLALLPDIRGYNLEIDNIGYIYFALANDGTANGLRVRSASHSIDDGEWHLLIVTYDGSSSASGITIYTDNADDTGVILADTLTGTTNTSEILTFAAKYGAEYYPNHLNGGLDNIIIFNKELTTDEASELWNDGDCKAMIS